MSGSLKVTRIDVSTPRFSGRGIEQVIHFTFHSGSRACLITSGTGGRDGLENLKLVSLEVKTKNRVLESPDSIRPFLRMITRTELWQWQLSPSYRPDLMLGDFLAIFKSLVSRIGSTSKNIKCRTNSREGSTY